MNNSSGATDGFGIDKTQINLKNLKGFPLHENGQKIEIPLVLSDSMSIRFPSLLLRARLSELRVSESRGAVSLGVTLTVAERSRLVASTNDPDEKMLIRIM